MNALITIKRKGAAGLVRELRDASLALEQLGTEHLSELNAISHAADGAAKAVTGLRGQVQDIEIAEAALRAYSLTAKRRIGDLLAALDPGGKGKPKGERGRAAEDAGISRADAKRLVQLAAIDPSRLSVLVDGLADAGKISSVGGILKADASVIYNPGYDPNEWYTPGELMRSAEMGAGIERFDVDAQSRLLAQKLVKANRWHSLVSPSDEAEQTAARAAGMTDAEIASAVESWGGIGGQANGRLTQPLHGHVWSSPPSDDPAPAIMSIVDAFCAKTIDSALVFVPVATSSCAQQALLRLSSRVLWIGKGSAHGHNRVACIQPNGKPRLGPDRDQAIYYLGRSPSTFSSEMSGWGTVTG